MMKKFYDANAESGETGAAASEATPDAGQDPSKGDPGSGEGNQPGGDKTPEDGGDKKPTIKGLTADLEAKNSEITGLTTKLGRQARSVGTLRGLQDSLKKDPQKTLQALASKTGTKVFFEDPGSKIGDIQKMFAEASDEDKGAIMAQLVGDAKGELRGEFSDITEAIFDQMKSSEHADWDDDAIVDTIAQMETAVDIGKMTKRELKYYAAKGFLAPGAITAAKAEGKAEYIAELQKKNAGELDPGGGGAPGAKEELSFEEVVEQLTGIF